MPVLIGLRARRLIKYIRQQTKVTAPQTSIFLILGVTIHKDKVTTLLMRIAEVFPQVGRDKGLVNTSVCPHMPFVVAVGYEAFQSR